MSKPLGSFVWYELLTTDLVSAANFYRAVLAWNTADAGASEHDYTLCSAGDMMVAGMMTMPEEVRTKSVPPCWTGYVLVEDVDECAKRVVAAGGRIERPASDIPGVGRFAVALDPQGAAIILFKNAEAPPLAPLAPHTPGVVGWRELHARDGDTALGFYTDLFGWTPSRVMDMGPMGAYHIFAIGGEDSGGVMTEQQQPKAFWLYYFVVDEIDDAAKRVSAAGGHVLHGPMQVPGGGSVLQCRDPQGAHFALFAPPH